MAGMHMDPAMMRHHVQEADSMAAAMRSHVQQIRRLSAEEQHVWQMPISCRNLPARPHPDPPDRVLQPALTILQDPRCIFELES
jgi:hypothetical protein